MHRSTSAQTTYQTATAQTGTLVVSVTATGQMNGDNRVAVDANVTGTVATIFVKNGDVVKAGQKIMHLNLDQNSQLSAQRAQSSLVGAQSLIIPCDVILTDS